MPKYWVKNYFTHGRFPEVGQKQKTEKERKKERKLMKTMAKLRMAHAITQAAWPKCTTFANDQFQPEEYNVETNNNFEALREPKIKASGINQNTVDKDVKVVENEVPNIDFDIYQEVFIDFIRNFSEEGSDHSKYLFVAEKMVNKNYKMFLKDVRNLNSKVGGFLAAHSRDKKVDSDLTGIIK